MLRNLNIADLFLTVRLADMILTDLTVLVGMMASLFSNETCQLINMNMHLLAAGNKNTLVSGNVNRWCQLFLHKVSVDIYGFEENQGC